MPAVAWLSARGWVLGTYGEDAAHEGDTNKESEHGNVGVESVFAVGQWNDLKDCSSPRGERTGFVVPFGREKTAEPDRRTGPLMDADGTLMEDPSCR